MSLFLYFGPWFFLFFEVGIFSMNVSMVGQKVSCWWDWINLLMLSICCIVLINQYFKMTGTYDLLENNGQVLCKKSSRLLKSLHDSWVKKSLRFNNLSPSIGYFSWLILWLTRSLDGSLHHLDGICRRISKFHEKRIDGLPPLKITRKPYELTFLRSSWNSKYCANAGLQRNGKSCRLRWINYLRPGLKRGLFSEQEEETILALHRTLGNK